MYELLSAIAFPASVAVVFAISEGARKLMKMIEDDHQSTMRALKPSDYVRPQN